jgi:alpha-glucosidase
VEAQEHDTNSTLALYRRALELRREFQTHERLEWIDTELPDVLAFSRPNGWTSVTNFGIAPVALPEGTVLVTSSPLTAGLLPGAATAWLLR